MFSIKYIEKSKDAPNGKIIGEISEEAGWIYGEDEFPFTFEVWRDKKLEWSCDLYPTFWASWDCLESQNLEILT